MRKLASNSRTFFFWPGKIKEGAISFKGSSTNRRKCARGCGKTNSSEFLVSDPNTIKSKSNGRASFITFFGILPNSFSKACNFLNNPSGVSFS